MLGTVLLGSVGLARRLLVLAPLFVGARSAHVKLCVHQGSMRPRCDAGGLRAQSRRAQDTVAEGRLQALFVYGAAPWVVRRVARGAGAEPFADPDASLPPRSRQVAGITLALALVAAVTPLGAAILVVTTALMSLVVLLGGARAVGRRCWR